MYYLFALSGIVLLLLWTGTVSLLKNRAMIYNCFAPGCGAIAEVRSKYWGNNWIRLNSSPCCILYGMYEHRYIPHTAPGKNIITFIHHTRLIFASFFLTQIISVICMTWLIMRFLAQRFLIDSSKTIHKLVWAISDECFVSRLAQTRQLCAERHLYI